MKTSPVGISKASAIRSQSEKDSITLTNQISVLLAVLPVIYIASNVMGQGWSRITIPILIQPVFFLFPIALNYLGFTTASRVWLSWLMPLQAMIFSIHNKSTGLDLETSHYMGIRFSILASSVIPFLVFRLKDSALILVSLSLAFITLACFDFIHNLFGVGYYQVGLKETGYSLTTMRVLIAFTLVTGASLFLKRLIEKKEAMNEDLISLLTDRNNEVLGQLEEIESQNNQILSQKDQLENQNQVIEQQNHALLDTNRELEMNVAEKTKDIRKANIELEKQNFQLEQFAFMAAHNLRSPVARIIGLSGLLNETSTNDAFNKKIIPMIKKSSSDLDDVIHDLISIVQVRSLANVDRKRINICTVLDKVLHDLRSDMETNLFEIKNTVMYDLEFNVNASFAHSVFTNIVDNCIRYRDENKTPVISFNAKQAGQEVELEIADNGIGFDSELYKEKIFKPFSRLDTTRSGKGLGLYLVKIQLESMGGHVSIRSKPNQGTVVSLKFQTSDSPF